MMTTETYCKTLDSVDRVAMIRAIHQAHLQLSALNTGLDCESFDNAPALQSLFECLKLAGHTGYTPGRTEYTLFRNADDLGEYFFRAVDNGGATYDRYTVAFSDGDGLALSKDANSPGGFSQGVEGLDPAMMQDAVERGDAVDLGWHDIPADLRDHILSRLNEEWRDYLESVNSMKPGAVASARVMASENEGTSRDAGGGLYSATGGSVPYYIRRATPVDDLGPFYSSRDALGATLPDHYGLAGPEYHSTATSGAAVAGAPCPIVAAQVAALEIKIANSEADQ